MSEEKTGKSAIWKYFAGTAGWWILAGYFGGLAEQWLVPNQLGCWMMVFVFIATISIAGHALVEGIKNPPRKYQAVVGIAATIIGGSLGVWLAAAWGSG